MSAGVYEILIICAQITGSISFVFQAKRRCVSTVKNRKTVCSKASTGIVMKSSNYEKVWNLIFDSVEPKWQPVSDWKNNEPGTLARNFKSIISLWLDRSRVRCMHTQCAWVLLFLENLESCSITVYPWESGQVLHLMNALLQQPLAGWMALQKAWAACSWIMDRWDWLPVMVRSQQLWHLCNNFNCGVFSPLRGLYVNTAKENKWRK